MTALPFSFFDAHCDTISCCTHDGRALRVNGGQVDLERGRRFRHYAQVFALYHDAANAPPDGMLAECRRQAGTFFSELEKNGELVMQCRTAGDFAQAQRSEKCAAMLSVEGADLLECDPARLEEAAAWGVKLINLTWNRANALSGSNIEEPERGLSPRGRDFVRRARALGILPDVSHLSDRGFWDVLELGGPVIASHSDSRALCAHPRNLTDEMFRALCETGGFVGLNFYVPFIGRNHTLDDLFAHLEHFLDLDGGKHVGFGGDWDGCEEMAGGLRGIQDMEKIYEEMLRRNYSAALIENLFYQNLRRVLFPQF